jgi:hypothetical protein
MPKEPDDRESRWKHVRKALAKPPSTAATIVIGIVSIFLAGLAASAAGYLVKPLDSATREARPVDFTAVAVGLVVGLLIAWIGTQLYYRLQRRTLELELEQTRAGLARLTRTKDTLSTVRIYADHLYNLLEASVGDELSLHNPAAADVEHFICDVSSQYLTEATGCRYTLSIWGERLTSRRATDKASLQVATPLPTSVTDRFEYLTGRMEPNEKEAFSVRITSSWLKHHRVLEEDDDKADDERSTLRLDAPHDNHGRTGRRAKDLERFVYSVDAPFHKSNEGDIKAWNQCGYQSVRVVSFHRPGMICYLIAASVDQDAFSEAEEIYLLWLKRVLELDPAMRNAATQQQSSQLDDFS